MRGVNGGQLAVGPVMAPVLALTTSPHFQLICGHPIPRPSLKHPASLLFAHRALNRADRRKALVRGAAPLLEEEGDV